MASSALQPDPSALPASLEIYLLGIVDFDAARFLQDRIVYDLSGRDDQAGALLLCEHPPLATVGREGSGAHLDNGGGEFCSREIDTLWINRGGGSIVHGPGQLAVYPIVPLWRLNIRPAEYPSRLIEAVVETCDELRVTAWPSEDGRGVCCRLGRLAEIGVAVKSGIAYQGLYLNVAPEMNLVRLATGGARRERWTSLTVQRGRTIEMHSVREALARRLQAILGYERDHLYTGHPLLKRTIRQVPQRA